MEEKLLYSVFKRGKAQEIIKAYGATADLSEAVEFAGRICNEEPNADICITEVVERTGGLNRHFSAQKLRLEPGSELVEQPKVFSLRNSEDVELLKDMLKDLALKELADKEGKKE